MLRGARSAESSGTAELARLKKTGKVIQLRKGLYNLADRYRKAPLHAPAIAQALCAQSYLSERWALSWYGLIPEKTLALS
jgi:predicted transcriptional regulator of viral defense system